MNKKNIKILFVTILAAVFVFSLVMLTAAASSKYVRITTTGSSFSPIVELKYGSDATVSWYVEENGETYTGSSPAIYFSSSSTRHVRLTAVPR